MKGLEQNPNKQALLIRHRSRNTNDDVGMCRISVGRVENVRRKGKTVATAVKGNIFRTLTVQNAKVSTIMKLLEERLLDESR